MWGRPKAACIMVDDEVRTLPDPIHIPIEGHSVSHTIALSNPSGRKRSKENIRTSLHEHASNEAPAAIAVDAPPAAGRSPPEA